ncbi:EexN family lipoprotein [Yersinia enterocolitica]|uniref:EexN family lipoprotein n=1 Tax=Enterobacteriaceae TaxID=543 RepID=UPI0015E57F65|nr:MULTISPECIES: EexN family lipoprotein [Enterobacteriaceae]EKN5943523.1 hypothetical protein [Yersinia enterocolitica]QLN66352.1 EexN family lipoprotein [Citrobacter freundii]QLO40514.1 EexN family lipoprotein [Klebsiella sp. RHBSTW-00484]QLT79830.1 EexN family lipoprotein [Klebsiella sp. RHBSTW-00464]QLW38828.1 EexN family lipoprotein [Citrobacter freundii]
MHKKAKLIMILSMLTLLAACKEEKSESWYKQHPDETYEVYSQCLKDGEASDNCEFSYRAALMFARAGNPGVKDKFENLFAKKEEMRRKVTTQ